ncbi:Putative intracellular protease/amidase [Raineyella antarctica]|uniref:Putative intracellular protease/amidase n=1 Tax=Raineyella antarctica TaxID=1577474 RepID=A0A1G6GPY5_9ACTN|nr:type 1 glutamine amidotransferase domain-containing protein [Raineyella antarctica]SDB83266.1 Putative intracellular protease/amidase [Raineyella antarctica]
MSAILMVLTSHDQLGDTGRKTGFWLEEFAAPYYVFVDAGQQVTLASPAGGQPPLDPKSDDEGAQTEATRRFKEDPAAQQALATTLRLADVDPEAYDAVFYPGGHGVVWDLPVDEDNLRVLRSFTTTDRPLAAVCHAPAIFRDAVDAQGEPFVKGRRVTGFTNTEEEGVELTEIVPFLVEDALRANGAEYSKGPDWGAHVIRDGNLVTGQNPASSAAAAEQLLDVLAGR